jgi:hypothetical protein
MTASDFCPSRKKALACRGPSTHEASRQIPVEFLEPNDLDIQHCENDKSQGAGEYGKFAVVASRRLMGRLISIGHKDLLGP